MPTRKPAPFPPHRRATPPTRADYHRGKPTRGKYSDPKHQAAYERLKKHFTKHGMPEAKVGARDVARYLRGGSRLPKIRANGEIVWPKTGGK